MSYIPRLETPMTYDSGNRLRVGSLTTLFDGKVLNGDDPILWETVGTSGLSAFQTNKISLSCVSNGQYMIRKSKRYMPYYSGKSQQVEMTADNFHTQTGITKRLGYFSSISAAPYNTELDGFWIEDDGVTKRFMVQRFGTTVYNSPLSAWDNAAAVLTYDFSKFSVFVFDFLWLGGANLRMFMRTPAGGLELIHTYHYPGTSQDVMIRSSNHPVRYEIRSTGGAGEFRPICSQVSTEGSINESGKHRGLFSGTAIAYALPTAGTTYALLGLRKKASERDKSVRALGFQGYVTSATDQVNIQLILNPTYTAGSMAWTDEPNSAAQKGLPSVSGLNITCFVTGGTVLYSYLLVSGQTIPPDLLEDDFLSRLGISIDNVSDELVLCATSVTNTVTIYSNINYKEF